MDVFIKDEIMDSESSRGIVALPGRQTLTLVGGLSGNGRVCKWRFACGTGGVLSVFTLKISLLIAFHHLFSFSTHRSVSKMHRFNTGQQGTALEHLIEHVKSRYSFLGVKAMGC